MTTVSVHDAARELRRRLPGAGTVKIHKLLYFSQGLHLGLSGEPIFGEDIEAWGNGPVVADLWHDEDKGRPIPKPESLNDSAIAIIDEVVRRFGHYSGKDLIRLTHTDGGPWCQITETEDDFFAPQNRTIPLQLMGTWFEKDESVAAHRAAADRIRARRLQLSESSAEANGLLDALRRISDGEVLCEAQPA